MIQDLFSKKLGFGTMRLPVIDNNQSKIDYDKFKEMIDYFYDKGFRYFDTAHPYHNGESEVAIGPCISDRYERSSFMLASKMPFWDVKEKEDLPRIFNDQLEKTKAGYFDLYLMHSLQGETIDKCEEMGGFEFGLKMKEEGKIKHLGFSFHDTADKLDALLTKHPEAEFVQLQINYFDWEDSKVQSKANYEVCVKHNKPVIVMEPVKGGNLAKMDKEYLDRLNAIEGKELSAASYAIRFVASLENVMVVLSGMSNLDQMKDNTSYMEDFKPLTDEQIAILLEYRDKLNEIETIPCTGCEYCVAGCPLQIPIPRIFRTINNQRRFKMYPDVKKRYEEITEGKGKASYCIECGQCEEHCPQHISIREELKKAVTELE